MKVTADNKLEINTNTSGILKKRKEKAEEFVSFCRDLEKKGWGEESGGDLDQSSKTEEDKGREVVT